DGAHPASLDPRRLRATCQSANSAGEAVLSQYFTTASGLLPAGTAIRGLADTGGTGLEIRYVVRRSSFSSQSDSGGRYPLLPAWEIGRRLNLNNNCVHGIVF